MRKKPLKAELVRLEAHAAKMSNQNGIYRQRLRTQEREFPARKRELVDELLPFVRALFKGVGDWASPDIPRDVCEQEIRRLLGLIDETEPAGDEVVLARPIESPRRVQR